MRCGGNPAGGVASNVTIGIPASYARWYTDDVVVLPVVELVLVLLLLLLLLLLGSKASLQSATIPSTWFDSISSSIRSMQECVLLVDDFTYWQVIPKVVLHWYSHPSSIDLNTGPSPPTITSFKSWPLLLLLLSLPLLAVSVSLFFVTVSVLICVALHMQIRITIIAVVLVLVLVLVLIFKFVLNKGMRSHKTCSMYR